MWQCPKCGKHRHKFQNTCTCGYTCGYIGEVLTRENEPELTHEEIWNPEDAQKSSTGSLRFNKGKPSVSNIPPEFILGMAEVLTYGEQKYGRANWKKGNNFSVPYDSAMRHILQWQAGESNDEESDSHHLFHAAVNLMMCYYYEQNFPDMDDR